jgi:hypothetical protein
VLSYLPSFFAGSFGLASPVHPGQTYAFYRLPWTAADGRVPFALPLAADFLLRRADQRQRRAKAWAAWRCSCLRQNSRNGCLPRIGITSVTALAACGLLLAAGAVALAELLLSPTSPYLCFLMRRRLHNMHLLRRGCSAFSLCVCAPRRWTACTIPTLSTALEASVRRGAARLARALPAPAALCIRRRLCGFFNGLRLRKRLARGWFGRVLHVPGLALAACSDWRMATCAERTSLFRHDLPSATRRFLRRFLSASRGGGERALGCTAGLRVTTGALLSRGSALRALRQRAGAAPPWRHARAAALAYASRRCCCSAAASTPRGMRRSLHICGRRDRICRKCLVSAARAPGTGGRRRLLPGLRGERR